MPDISCKITEAADKAEVMVADVFKRIERIAQINTKKVLDAFREEKVSESCFSGTTGYGYDDLGRETLERIYSRIFDTESALVRINFVNGTHAISTALFAMMKPGDTLLSVSGPPYDTLLSTVDPEGKNHGSLGFYGVKYKQTDLLDDGRIDLEETKHALTDDSVTAVIIQRSRGYGVRRALSIAEIGEACRFIKSIRPDINILVDNCYGEFTEEKEPTNVGADLIAGSLIKNPGGGIAPCGGYIAGKKSLVEKAANHLTAPGIGGECGPSLNINRLLFQGLFMAPHIVSQALKTAVFSAALLKSLGFSTSPEYDALRSDIIQVINLGTEEKMKAFCKGIQSGSPVDSYVTPEPWPMPGYNCNVIMAAGSFNQGSSIELSADGPIRDPYCIYIQGGLTYEAGKLGIMMAADNLMNLA